MRAFHFKIFNYEFVLASLVALFLSHNHIILKISVCPCIKNIYEIRIFRYLNEHLC